MAIWLNKETRLVVQGITGKEGKFHALGCRDYGTQVVAGVTPGKGGETVEGIPVFDSVEEARAATGANASMVFVPPPFAADAIMEAADAGIELVVAITEGIPVNDMIRAKAFLRGKPKTRLIGPSTCVGIGGDPINGTNFLDVMKAFRDDKETDAVILIGEIGGSAEEEAAAWIQANYDRPVVGFIAGRTAPPGRRMGHAGAIVAGGKGTAAAKMEAMTAAGIHVCESPADLGATVARALGKS